MQNNYISESEKKHYNLENKEILIIDVLAALCPLHVDFFILIFEV